MVMSRDYKTNEDCTSGNVHSYMFIHVHATPDFQNYSKFFTLKFNISLYNEIKTDKSKLLYNKTFQKLIMKL